jgi:quinol-cytochrome oxidoreductase complex cytochrome b subunit
LATVITNLLSAIPVFGQDIVELIWGGLKNLLEPYYGNIILKILLNAGKSPNLEIVYAFSFF